ncbi:MAG TPA: glycerol-3-phosphate 1-O-acyltransferase PlsY [Polyangia bacterium]|nr:glycerol-3-phosphate 1-O-acyltransferase PlsY [Polyangia bacterium]
MAALFVLAAFAAGSIPTGVIVARARGVDLRKVGSGNIGATNVGRALGKGWAIFVLLFDALKGYVPAALASRWLPPFWVAVVALAAVLCHMFSVFLKGRGGKGVATSLGAALALSPLAALCSAGAYLLLYAAFRISSLGSLVGVSGFPLALYLTGDRERAHYLFAGVMAVLVIARHKDNIRRLVKREELKS